MVGLSVVGAPLAMAKTAGEDHSPKKVGLRCAGDVGPDLGRRVSRRVVTWSRFKRGWAELRSAPSTT